MKLYQRLEFSSAHRLLGYNGNCGTLHGHTWQCEIEINSDRKLDEFGMLVDYRVLKGIIKDSWDHKTILNSDDPLVELLTEAGNDVTTLLEMNPTAENLAKVAHEEVVYQCGLKPEEVIIRIHESAENYAEYYV